MSPRTIIIEKEKAEHVVPQFFCVLVLPFVVHHEVFILEVKNICLSLNASKYLHQSQFCVQVVSSACLAVINDLDGPKVTVGITNANGPSVCLLISIPSAIQVICVSFCSFTSVPALDLNGDILNPGQRSTNGFLKLLTKSICLLFTPIWLAVAQLFHLDCVHTNLHSIKCLGKHLFYGCHL